VEVASVDLVKASNPHDEIFIVNFNDEAYLDVEFTNDIKKMEAGLARIDSRRGHRYAGCHQHVHRLLEGKGEEP